MGIIHEMLYQSDNSSLIRFKNYLIKLIGALIKAFKGAQHHIKYTIEYPEKAFNIVKAVSVGLIINKLISSSLKHSISNQNPVHLTIRLVVLDRINFQVNIIDDSVGIQAKKQQQKKISSNLLLVRKLVVQLSVTIKLLLSKQGCHHRIIFSGRPLIE
jgi:two-component sensor histidine kinase